MARPTLLAVISLDGAWRTPEASIPLLKRFLALALAGKKGLVVTDIPALRRRRLPGLAWKPGAEIAAWVGKGKKGGLILGTPGLHARLLAEAAPEIVLLWRPEIVLSAGRANLASSFLPADGKRLRFRPASHRETPDGLLCRYLPAANGARRNVDLLTKKSRSSR